MKPFQLRKVLLISVVLLFAAGLIFSNPAVAARVDGKQPGEKIDSVSSQGKAIVFSSVKNSDPGYAGKSIAISVMGDGQSAAEDDDMHKDMVEVMDEDMDDDKDDDSSINSTDYAAKVYGASNGGRPLTGSLSGAEEVPSQGDEDGTGSVLITLNQGQEMVCWELTVTDIAAATAAHIHRGEIGVAGPVVVTLSAPDEQGLAYGCTSADPELIKEIRQHPTEFYVNVHNTEFPAGALRTQLAK